MRKDLKKWKVYWPENGRKGQSSERVPHYCRKADEWRCMVEDYFGNRYEERGCLEHVMGEFAGYNETYDFNIKENEYREGGWQDHEHSFEGVLISLLKHPEHFSIDGFEEQYSIQQMELLKAVKKKLLAMGRDNGDSKDSALAEWESGKLRAKYLNVILFPSDYFDPSEVDPDLKAEYAAVKEDKVLTPILFNYEAWFEHGKLVLSDDDGTVRGAVYRGWMMKPEQYEKFYDALRKKKIFLMTSPDEYRMLHMFPNVYEHVREDSARILTFQLHEPIDISLIRKSFPKFMVKDYVKSVKGTEFPKFFDEKITQEEFDRWMEVFYKYRGNLLTGGICIKEYLDLKRYDGKTNEYRVFYAGGKGITLEANSGQCEFTPKPPRELLKKYCHLDSPFYTVDYAELEDGSWRVVETGDGGVSGLSDRQDIKAFYRALSSALR